MLISDGFSRASAGFCSTSISDIKIHGIAQDLQNEQEFRPVFFYFGMFGNVDDSTRRDLENISYSHAKGTASSIVPFAFLLMLS